MDRLILAMFSLLFFYQSSPFVAPLVSEFQALMDFKNGFDGNNDVFVSWNSDSICDWFCITCNDEKKVIRIAVSGYGLSGYLSSSVSSLSSLEQLLLYNNNISGNIPSELGKLTKLKQLVLYDNLFNGSIPDKLGDLMSLQLLFLENNKLTGQIPSSLTSISSLQRLNVSYNSLSGTIPISGSFAKFKSNSFLGNHFDVPSSS